MSKCTCKQAGAHALTRTRTHSIHAMLVLSLSCTEKRAATLLQWSGPKTERKMRSGERKNVPLIAYVRSKLWCSLETKRGRQRHNQFKTADTIQDAQYSRVLKPLKDKPSESFVSDWCWSVESGVSCLANCYNRDQYLSYKSSIF